MKRGVIVLFCVIVISGCASTTNEKENVDAFDEILGKRLAEQGYSAEEIECQVKSEREHYLYRGLTSEHYKKEQAKYSDPFNEFLKRTLEKQGYTDAFDEFLGKTLARQKYTPDEIESTVEAMRKSYYKRGLTSEHYKKEQEYHEKKSRSSCIASKARQAEFERTLREKARKDYQNGHIRQPTYQYQPSYDPNFEIRRLRDDLTIQSIIQRGEAEKREKEMIHRLETERSQRESMERVQEQRRQIEQFHQEQNRQREMHKLRQDLLYRGIY